ncbi:MAG: DNA-formamidopyrimidine glycosylase [Candidatus Izemoplasmatales bacterium]|jgi:formamidopyrimidine-DNA glycosylase|nr:DNA-formamidopyrimidine glycosylase [Candidatus Izemoplasmatales bacterium]
MPELPEVETVKETLKIRLLGLKIVDVIAPYPLIIKMDFTEFKFMVINQTFRDIRRYGKYLFFVLDDYTLVSHLRMEGKYFLRENLDQLTKHEHVVFSLSNGLKLAYHDVRKFGTMELVKKGEEFTLLSVKKLGLEANDPSIDKNEIFGKISKAHRPIKSVLLDQSILTGLGNIYVDETLFRSRIHPEELAANLSEKEVFGIINNAKIVLNKAINLGGTTIRTYQSSFGVDGRFQNELKVHTMVGKPCQECGTTIEKIKIGGRGTYFCPKCQVRKSI